MSVKDESVYIRHALDCIADIERYVGNDKQKFLRDDLTRNACLRQLQIMPESCMRLSDAVKKDTPAIDWKQIKGFRNVVAHDYLGDIDFDKIWHVIERRLPELKAAMAQALIKHGSKS